MRVRHVSILPTEAAQEKQRIALTPELLAATGARYSRSNEGLDAIVSRIDWKQTDKSVDAIFRMVDYGHASIADMAPVAMFLDGISLYAAYILWSLAPTASGQESSTRYIQMEKKGVVHPRDLGIKDAKKYYAHVERAFAQYHRAITLWTHAATKNPSLMRIPETVLADTSEKGLKRLERMRRNFAFDRARIYLPVCAKTNVMMIMSARSWVDLISTLLSHPSHECKAIGKQVRDELALVTPRLIKHAQAKKDTELVWTDTLKATQKKSTRPTRGDGAFCIVHEYKKNNLYRALAHRSNRYSLCGDDARMTPVTFGWSHIALAEMRDLNRHRTGQKLSLLKPNGFYDAQDQAPTEQLRKRMAALARLGTTTQNNALKMLADGDPLYIYFTLLGHTYSFTHTTTLDKFVYEAELRTGVGSHYRYAHHLKNVLALLYRKHPRLKQVIHEGGAEPE